MGSVIECGNWSVAIPSDEEVQLLSDIAALIVKKPKYKYRLATNINKAFDNGYTLSKEEDDAVRKKISLNIKLKERIAALGMKPFKIMSMEK